MDSSEINHETYRDHLDRLIKLREELEEVGSILNRNKGLFVQLKTKLVANAGEASELELFTALVELLRVDDNLSALRAAFFEQ